MPLYTLADQKLRNPWLALAIDEAVCRHFAGNPGFSGLVRLWKNPDAVCLGRTCDARKNLRPEEFARIERAEPGLPVLRRASGGGTVLHGPGSWNYTIALSMEKFPQIFAVQRSYEIFLGMVIRALAAQSAAAEMKGQSDLVLLESGRKISGNAQFRKRGVCVHHGTLLVDAEFIARIAHILPHPPKEPDYRAGRSHENFLGALPVGFSVSLFFSQLFQEAAAFTGERPQVLPPEDRKKIFQLAGKLAKKIYTNRTWILEGQAPGV